MKILTGAAGRDFTILNITDSHVETTYFTEDTQNGRIFKGTIKELIDRTSPDLITFTGDITREDGLDVYRLLAELVDSFGIPWAPVLGNHDNESGPEFTDKLGDVLMSCENCLFEKGDPSLGCGNYVLGAVSGDRKMGLVLMDTHDCFYYYDGEKKRHSWGEITPEQGEWYRERVAELRSEGFNESILFVHVPLYEYSVVANEVFDPYPEEGAQRVYDFPEEYIKDKDAYFFGINYEGPSCPSRNGGFFEVICDEGHTKNVICGHNHVNTSSALHRGVRLTYGVKTGAGSYHEEHLNGGTVLKLGRDGETVISHVYVDASKL